MQNQQTSSISSLFSQPLSSVKTLPSSIKRWSTYALMGAGLLANMGALASTDKQLVVFGHNPYEQGNFPSIIGVLDNTYSGVEGNRIGTGPSIADVVSQQLFDGGVIAQTSSAALFSGQGTNYAVATAASRTKADPLSSLIGMPTQVNSYLAATPSSDVARNLYIFAPGQNDILDAVGTSQFPLLSCERFTPWKYWRVYRDVRHMDGEYSGRFAGTEYERVAKLMYAAIESSKSMLDQLQQAGAKDILIPNVASPSLFPIFRDLAAGFGCDTNILKGKSELLTYHFNASIQAYVYRIENKDMLTYDIQADIKTLQDSPEAYGFSDASNNCYLLDISQPQVLLNPAVQCDDSNENDFLHYTALTLTTNADDFIGRKMAATLVHMAR